MAFIYLNDRLVDTQEALVPVTERGFRFGDGVFETLRVHRGMPYLWDAHLARLHAGLTALSIAFDTQKLREACEELLRQNAVTEGILRIGISRGTGSLGYFPTQESGPTLVIETLPLPSPPPLPLRLWRSGFEKISPRALPAFAKLSQGVNATLALLEARAQQCDDALQCDAQGHIAETSSANLFWLARGRLYTPALTTGCLPGTIRARLLALSPYPVEEVNAPVTALEEAEAVALSNSGLLVAPAGALLPHEMRWESAALAAKLRGLIERDMADDIRRGA